MSSTLTGAAVAVLGGDDRELVLVPELVRMGAKVSVAGITKLAEIKDVQYYTNIGDAVRNARFIILPMPGIDEQGVVRAKYGAEKLIIDKETLRAMPDDCVLIVGVARPRLKEMAAHRGLKLVEIAEMDEVAIPNSIPSAEGAIQMAMEATDFTLHGSKSLVLGFGRCGITLARMLNGLGAKTSVAARKPGDLARITEMGLESLAYRQLEKFVGKFDIIFNTVPVLVLDRTLLEKVKKSVYICDIASAPGGVDFVAAKELGLKADLAPGLPGKVAPKTAGHILAHVVPEIIARELAITTSLSTDSDRREPGVLGCE